MSDILKRAIKESIIILVVVVVVALIVNFTRGGGIPLIADGEAFRIQTNANFMIPADAEIHFSKGTAVFLDAREERLFAAGHIEGAMNVPSTGTGADSLAFMVPADPVLVCYASEETERQAGVIADRLLEIGFTQVYVLHGGLEAWKDLGLPTGKGN